MSKIFLRYQQIKDAKRFYEILNNPNFIYLNVKPKSIADEKEFLRKSSQKRKDNFEWNYSIIYQNQVIGSVGIKINQHRKYIGEIGYFIDEKYWGRGIASQAAQLVEKIGVNKLGIKRLEILINPANKASEKVALKTGYKKEGFLKKVLPNQTDAYLYAKTF